ncbi:putative glycosyltransferase [Bacillus sp. TS-2]|nr:putative glycosyltransferase [Bacillus sp. TS-2]
MQKVSLVIVALLFSVISFNIENVPQSLLNNQNPLSKVMISISSEEDKWNLDNPLLIWEDHEMLKKWEEIIAEKVPLQGSIDIRHPDYLLQFFYENSKENYFLWLGQENGESLIMDGKDFERVYTVKENQRNELRDLILKTTP